jgi:hypothetical protein
MIVRPLRRPLAAALAVLLPSLALAQGTPLPLPSEPGGARPPVYTQPPGSSPVRPTPPIAPIPPSVSPTVPAPLTSGGASEQSEEKGAERQAGKVPQVTSFPELTRGIGNAKTLLQE